MYELKGYWEGTWNTAFSGAYLSLFVVLPRIAIPGIKCHSQNNLGKKGLISFYKLTSQSINNGSQDRNLEAGTEAEAMGECFLQVCS
jgi:hypothetical protein